MDNFADIYKIALSCGVLHLINSIEEFVTYLNVNNNTDGAFNKFFSIIDKNNKNVLNNLIGLIKMTSKTLKYPAVYIDRDGTINEEAGYISHPNNFVLYPFAAHAIKLFNVKTFMSLLSPTNQG